MNKSKTGKLHVLRRSEITTLNSKPIPKLKIAILLGIYRIEKAIAIPITK
ncbi:MAG: hypothetical protein ACOCTT_02815 [archaeon]